MSHDLPHVPIPVDSFRIWDLRGEKLMNGSTERGPGSQETISPEFKTRDVTSLGRLQFKFAFLTR